MKTSENLTVGHVYTRNDLKEMFDVRDDQHGYLPTEGP
jgi:hypothetical protein